MEAQQATAATEARSVEGVQLAAPVVVALPVTSVVEAHPALAAAEVRSGVVVVAQQEPALAGSSQATTVEIPDDDVPPPEWNQWASLPMPAPTPQAGALVRRWDGHMVTGGRGHGAEDSSSRAGPPASGEERVDEPPPLRRCP
jgi:hypothetical protein